MPTCQYARGHTLGEAYSPVKKSENFSLDSWSGTSYVKGRTPMPDKKIQCLAAETFLGGATGILLPYVGAEVFPVLP